MMTASGVEESHSGLARDGRTESGTGNAKAQPSPRADQTQGGRRRGRGPREELRPIPNEASARRWTRSVIKFIGRQNGPAEELELSMTTGVGSTSQRMDARLAVLEDLINAWDSDWASDCSP